MRLARECARSAFPAHPRGAQPSPYAVRTEFPLAASQRACGAAQHPHRGPGADPPQYSAWYTVPPRTPSPEEPVTRDEQLAALVAEKEARRAERAALRAARDEKRRAKRDGKERGKGAGKETGEKKRSKRKRDEELS